MLFFLSTLLCFAGREFQRSDGNIEYLVARRMLTSGAVDLPQFSHGLDHRVQPGREGKFYSHFGLGQSLVFMPALLADRAAVLLFGLDRYGGVSPDEPFFFSITINALVLALAGVCLTALLRELGVSPPTALLTATLFLFGTNALSFSQLSFDMPLSILSTLATFLFLFRATERGGRADWVLCGVSFTVGVLTRANNAGLLLPMALYLGVRWSARWRADRASLRRWWPGIALLALFVAAAGLLQLAYNHHRYGSFLDMGYNRPGFPFHFGTPLSESLPALLFSPGRSLFVFALPTLLCFPGFPRFLREGRERAWALLLAAAFNLVLFAKWSYWPGRFSFGPRFQLVLVPLLLIPAAFWLDANRERLFAGRLRWLSWTVVLAFVAIQLPSVLTGFDSAGVDSRAYWGLEQNQILGSFSRFAHVVGRGAWWELRLFWVTPCGRSPLLFAVLGASLVAAVLSGMRLRRHLRLAVPAPA